MSPQRELGLRSETQPQRHSWMPTTMRVWTHWHQPTTCFTNEVLLAKLQSCTCVAPLWLLQGQQSWAAHEAERICCLDRKATGREEGWAHSRHRPWSGLRAPVTVTSGVDPTLQQRDAPSVHHVCVLEKRESSEIPFIHQKQTGRRRESEQRLQGQLTGCLPTQDPDPWLQMQGTGALPIKTEAELPQTQGFLSGWRQDSQGEARSWGPGEARAGPRPAHLADLQSGQAQQPGGSWVKGDTG